MQIQLGFGSYVCLRVVTFSERLCVTSIEISLEIYYRFLIMTFYIFVNGFFMSNKVFFIFNVNEIIHYWRNEFHVYFLRHDFSRMNFRISQIHDMFCVYFPIVIFLITFQNHTEKKLHAGKKDGVKFQNVLLSSCSEWLFCKKERNSESELFSIILYVLFDLWLCWRNNIFLFIFLKKLNNVWKIKLLSKRKTGD